MDIYRKIMIYIVLFVIEITGMIELGSGILKPSMAMICSPNTPIKRAWKSREPLLQRKPGTRSKHFLKMEWPMPEWALLKACCEHLTVPESGVPDDGRSSLKNSSKDAEI